MKPRSLLVLLLVLAAAGVCVRLGFWQISRWHEKRAMNVATAAALKQPPLDVSGRRFTPARARGSRVRARGHYDESRQILLSARSHQGAPGVDVVTPLLIDDSTAVLVDRGWVYSADAATARPERFPEPGPVDVIGMAETLRVGAGGPAIRTLPDSLTLYSARWLDRDSLAGRLPWALMPFAIRQLPGPGVPDQPLRRAPEPVGEFTHVSYAIQWFLFAVILLVGSALLARSRARGPREAPDFGPRS